MFRIARFFCRKKIEILSSDLQYKMIKGGGPGGQSINKTNNCVQLRHIPTGIIIKQQSSRSLQTNKQYAMKRLKIELDNLINGKQSKEAVKLQKQSKQKDRNRRRSMKKYNNQKQDKPQ